ncbi:hypothetical protein HPB49_005459 [Dermacentor silvarum]|uniref:Uncharacterized protein n=1 Tax=Dermacentor silvarum TaxID=543639 RepID=A0ACB8DB08_DERSI|nr:hypothetical protein HPB49_005459 [Dermacentor silvarum]
MSFINWRVATAEDLATLNAQLTKTELQRRSLSTTGNKEELIDRLLVDNAKDLPPSHEPAPCVPAISTSFPTMPVHAYDVIPSHANLYVRPSREHAAHGSFSSLEQGHYADHDSKSREHMECT